MPMLPSGLFDYVADEESLARFLNAFNLFNASGLIRPAAFMPHKGEVSVFRLNQNASKELWETGEKHLKLPKGRQIHGAAFIGAVAVRRSSLDVEAKEPPPKHANIVGWQAGDKAMAKARNKELAILLAQQAELKKKP